MLKNDKCKNVEKSKIYIARKSGQDQSLPLNISQTVTAQRIDVDVDVE